MTSALAQVDRRATVPNCNKCGKPNQRKGQRWCRACHAEYQRDWRPKRTVEFHENKRKLRKLEDNVARETSTSFQAKRVMEA